LCVFSSLAAPAPTALSTLSLHDALPISLDARCGDLCKQPRPLVERFEHWLGALLPNVAVPRLQTRLLHYLLVFGLMILVTAGALDRKSTRLNSSHVKIAYAVFCLKKQTS